MSKNRSTRRSARTLSLAGYGFIAAGVAGYAAVRQQLLAENITVHPDVKSLAGKKVADPVTAYAQADIVNKHALAMTGGKPFAELTDEEKNQVSHRARACEKMLAIMKELHD